MAADARYAARPTKMEGLRIAQLWDFLFRGDEIFEMLEDPLRERLPGAEFVSWRTFGSTHGGDEAEVLAALPARLRQAGVDLVLSGIGCCGSCTPAVLRASLACEKAGFPTISLICEGFLGQASVNAEGLGLPGLALARIPGHVDVMSTDELRRAVSETTADAIVTAVSTVEPAPARATTVEYEPREIVFEGDLDAVLGHYERQGWSDGLPIIPPTIERVEAFLQHTGRKADEVVGVMVSDNRAATVWSVAVNGVMAGCRPEHMPALIAIAEAMCDPAFGIERNSSSGAETLIMLNGPAIGELGFNFEQGVLRDGFRANTSVGRFFRLYFRNVAGFLPHQRDKATFGNTWRVVMAENEDVLAEIGWPSIAEEAGYGKDDSVVTIARYSGGDVLPNVSGSRPQEIAVVLAGAIRKMITWQVRYTLGFGDGMLRPLLLLTPIIARSIAAGGWSKSDLKRCLFEHCRIPADDFEKHLVFGDETRKAIWNIADYVRMGKTPASFLETEDPQRLVPIVHDPEDFMIAVTGDPLRTNCYVFAPTGILGYPTSRKMEPGQPATGTE
ncbi:hypothetical protein [Aquamicrobium sp. LC103]|uniref:UGSC family (seleno)protein n=1 Tax=Aquamicrobium sp. LC103 TaxID=1120658 RepID=UPI000699DD0D|nr:hypothetical protein [Aquamicrobium sp. LC103]TKT74471.1 hypothetical protein XW59_023845 [Aquamicrobium sp. LC103]